MTSSATPAIQPAQPAAAPMKAVSPDSCAHGMPVVSVVIPTHNRCSLLRTTLQSVIEQTFADWECIVVDDCSTDDTQRMLRETCASDSRFVVVTNQRNSGNTLTRSAGCARARGAFIALLDDDDSWEPDKLEKQVAAMRCTDGLIWSYHSAKLVKDATIVGVEPARDPQGLFRDMMHYNVLRHSSVMVRRHAFEAIGGYDTKLKLASDWDLLLRLLTRFGAARIAALPDVWVNYRIHDSNISSAGNTRIRAERRVVRRMLIGSGLVVRKPLMALRLIDGQLGREMHRWQKGGKPVRAFAAALCSAVIWPGRVWRWQRAWAFFGSIFRPARAG